MMSLHLCAPDLTRPRRRKGLSISCLVRGFFRSNSVSVPVRLGVLLLGFTLLSAAISAFSAAFSASHCAAARLLAWASCANCFLRYANSALHLSGAAPRAFICAASPDRADE